MNLEDIQNLVQKIKDLNRNGLQNLLENVRLKGIERVR